MGFFKMLAVLLALLAVLAAAAAVLRSRLRRRKRPGPVLPPAPPPQSGADAALQPAVEAVSFSPGAPAEEGPSPEADGPGGVAADQVRFSLISRKKAAVSDVLQLELYMYEDAYRRVVDERLEEEGSLQERDGGYGELKRRSRVTATMRSKDIGYEEELTLLWAGRYLLFDFAAEIPEDCVKRRLLFTADVCVEGFRLTRLNMQVSIDRETETPPVERRDVTSAFISYSSRDREQVASIVYGMKKARPDMDIFFDVERLSSGERWEETLKQEVLSRQLLYLCWSRNAKASEWVDREWRCAYEAKGIEGVEPIPLEAPEVCPPPEELNGMHFNDILLMVVRNADRGIGAKQSPKSVMDLRSGRCVSLGRQPVMIGRDAQCTLTMEGDSCVSRRHCTLSAEGQQRMLLLDMSSNDTCIYSGDSCRVLTAGCSAEVFSGDVLRLGNSFLLLA